MRESIMKKKYVVPIAILSIVVILFGTYFIYSNIQAQRFFKSHQNNDSLVEQSQFIYKNKWRRISRILSDLEVDHKTNNWDQFIEVIYVSTNDGTFTFAPQNDDYILMSYSFNRDTYVKLKLEKNDQIEPSFDSNNLSEEEIKVYRKKILDEYRDLLDRIYQNQ